ncbi:MAG: HAD hydrolase-like protein [Bacteriovoracaceae bacterium]|nr:HAD hydrolase-like protein [Bacteriovoracaceae bacterium]
MKNYKLIIFDFDGTLADSYSWFRESINKAARKYHFREIDAVEMEALRGQKTKEIMQYLGVAWWKVPFIAKYMRGLMTEDLASITLFSGIDSVIKKLADDGALIVILSSNSYHNVAGVLGGENVKWINHFECGVSIFGKKAKLKKVIRKYRKSPEQVISIGDETRDIEAARVLGIHSGAVAWGYATVKALEAESPTYIFNSVEELRQILQ